jgi:hypothetical protein
MNESSTAAQTAASATSPIPAAAADLAKDLHDELATAGPLIDRLEDFSTHLSADERELVLQFANLSGHLRRAADR